LTAPRQAAEAGKNHLVPVVTALRHQFDFNIKTTGFGFRE
jgi:hypothetical protein